MLREQTNKWQEQIEIKASRERRERRQATSKLTTAAKANKMNNNKQ